MFRDDFEFNDAARASHLDAPASSGPADRDPELVPSSIPWQEDAERELGKVPFFVRGKARRNTEAYAAEHGLGAITIETLYDAKAHFAR
jgi:light-independent protochlorophyllide reductase subunit B